MKFSPFSFILFIFIYTDKVKNEIVIQKAGITAISPGDMGIIFYFYLENKMTSPYYTEILTKDCREDNSPACNVTLLGSGIGSIGALESKKIELVWPNLYVFNRKGFCRIVILYKEREDVGEFNLARYKVYFDTSLSNKQVQPAFKAVYPQMREKCATEDLDPLYNCTPVDCLIKYGGCKNYFNKQKCICEVVNACVYESKDPYNGYIPVSNQCKNIRSRLQISEVDKIRHTLPHNSVPAEKFYPKSRNKHGHFNQYCSDCHSGWKTVRGVCSKSPEYQMCTVHVENWKQNYFKKINNTLLVFGILSVLIAIGVLLLTFCCYCLHRCICHRVQYYSYTSDPGVCDKDYNYDIDNTGNTGVTCTDTTYMTNTSYCNY